MTTMTKSLLVGSALLFASACFAARPLPENPGLTDARQPALPAKGEELSLFGLEERLRETNALTPLRKEALRTEIDALVVRFRHARALGRANVAALRPSYDRLMAKMQAMLTDDPQLAADVTVSKEPIWGTLADRSQSASLR